MIQRILVVAALVLCILALFGVAVLGLQVPKELALAGIALCVAALI